jgi:hypothetical protein
MRFARLRSTGSAERSAEMGSGSTPRNGPGSIATAAAARPRPARICVSRPPDEWPTIAGLQSSLLTTAARWSATPPTVLLAKASGCAAACSTRLWIVGPTWREHDVASLFEQLRPAILAVWQQPQTVHEHDGHPARCICSVDLLLVAVPKGGQAKWSPRLSFTPVSQLPG